MDFEKLQAQRDAKTAANSEPKLPNPVQISSAKAPEEATGGKSVKPKAAEKSAPQPKESKRDSWKACTFYLPAETKQRLVKVLLRIKLEEAEGPADQSEAINEALQQWLKSAEKRYGN